MNKIKIYYQLTKPGIIYGNAITASGGFFLAARAHPNIFLLIAMLLGLSFIVASACVLNNIKDSDIDSLMNRTKKRALPTGQISKKSAFFFATLLGIIGSVILALFVNFLTLFISLFGLVFYAAVYTYFKRRTVHGMLIGCISGAVPPVVGYTAITGRLDLAALILFLILVFWQMPHFYAISIYRLRDYAAANIPVVSIVAGVPATKIITTLLIAGFTVLTSFLTFFGYAGNVYLFTATVLGLSWLAWGLINFKKRPDDLWARQMFRHSLVVIVFLFVAMAVDSATFRL